jgi:hypothetical protein
MPGYVVEFDSKAPAEYVAAWWNDYRAEDTELTRDLTFRRVEPLDDRRTHLTSDVLFGKRPIRVECVVTRAAPTSWDVEGDLIVNGKKFAREIVHFQVAPLAAGSRLSGEFRFRGRTPVHSFVLFLLNGRSRREREEAYRAYRTAIDRDFTSGRPARTTG